MMKRALLSLWILLAATWTAVPAAAHNLELTDVLVVLKNDGTYQVDMTCDLDALALGVSPTADSAELFARLEAMSAAELAERVDGLHRLFERRVRVFFDGERVTSVITFPDRGTALASSIEPPTFLGLTARLEGVVPEGGATFSFRASRAFPPVHLTLLRQGDAPHRELVPLGTPSTPVALASTGEKAAGMDARHVSGRYVAGQYLVLGFWHIVPEGLDHILFVLGLYLLAARMRPLLWQVSAFTAAHTVTLALATYGVVELSASVVEPLIALSIAYVAMENVFTEELKPWRPWLVFSFGLLHGLGFAGVLGELGLPRQEMLAGLLSFNVGVELGQLAVLLVAFLLLGWAREKDFYHRRVVIPLSLMIAAVGLYWAVERTFSG